MNGKCRLEIKNSSKTVDFGLYDAEIRILTDGGRIETGKAYTVEFERPDQFNLKIRIIDN
jgi:hypothetical protein